MTLFRPIDQAAAQQAQLNAARETGNPVRLVAGPGSGKSRTVLAVALSSGSVLDAEDRAPQTEGDQRRPKVDTMPGFKCGITKPADAARRSAYQSTVPGNAPGARLLSPVGCWLVIRLPPPTPT